MERWRDWYDEKPDMETFGIVSDDIILMKVAENGLLTVHYCGF